MLKTAFTMLPMFISLFWLLMFIVEHDRNKFIRFILISFFGVAFFYSMLRTLSISITKSMPICISTRYIILQP